MDETKVQIGEDVLLDIGTHSDWYISAVSYDGESVNVDLRRKADRHKEWWLADTPLDEFFREPTAEERKAVADYIDSISVPTGVNVFDLMDEPQTDCPKSCPTINICTKDDTDCPWK